MNGEAATGSGTQKVLNNGVLDNIKLPLCILKKLGLYELVSMLITVSMCRLGNLFH